MDNKYSVLNHARNSKVDAVTSTPRNGSNMMSLHFVGQGNGQFLSGRGTMTSAATEPLVVLVEKSPNYCQWDVPLPERSTVEVIVYVWTWDYPHAVE
jgi:hypothetical protein